jgi:hypothetical protein
LDGVLGGVTSTYTSVRFAVGGFLMPRHITAQIVGDTYALHAQELYRENGGIIAFSTYVASVILMVRKEDNL